MFVKGFENNVRTHYIHIVKWNGIKWDNYILFRDFLNIFLENDVQFIQTELSKAISAGTQPLHYRKTRNNRKLIQRSKAMAFNAVALKIMIHITAYKTTCMGCLFLKSLWICLEFRKYCDTVCVTRMGKHIIQENHLKITKSNFSIFVRFCSYILTWDKGANYIKVK